METNSLVYKVLRNAEDGTQYEINIRLNDEHKNGHQDFAITGTMWEAGKPRTERNEIVSGAIGEEIAKAFPMFKIFGDLHLCDYLGNPMYATANGFYHLQNKEVAMNYLRINEWEWNILKDVGDQDHLGYALVHMGITDRWKKEADEAIELLEELTGNTFVIDSKKNQFGMSKEKLDDIEAKVNSGHYEPDAIQARKSAEFEGEKSKKIKAIEDGVASKKLAMETEALIKITILRMGFLNDNFIYYSHSNSITFNWLDYKDKFKKEEVEQIIDRLKNTGSFNGEYNIK